MRRVSIADPAFTYDDDDPEGYRAGLFRFGSQLGAEKTGTSVYELPPGQAICPYHYEYGEEEWALVLSGRPTLRTPEGEQELAPMDVVFFPPGRDGAHKISNRADVPARVMMWSTISDPAASVYPDSDKIGIFTGDKDDSLLVRRSSRVGYYDGEG